MILIWIGLFIAVVAISFYLALRSMQNYQEKPANFSTPYSLYLIQKREELTPEVLSVLYQQLLPNRALISFERLFKGARRALVVYGPVQVLEPFKDTLGLLELEDYSHNPSTESVVAWQVGSRHGKNQSIEVSQPLEVSQLHDSEEVWWQLVLQPVAGGVEDVVNKAVRNVTVQSYNMATSRQQQSTPKDPNKAEAKNFNGIIRVVVISQDHRRRELLQTEVGKLGAAEGLIKLPQTVSSKELLDQYKQRGLKVVGLTSLLLELKGVLSLLKG